MEKNERESVVTKTITSPIKKAIYGSPDRPLKRGAGSSSGRGDRLAKFTAQDRLKRRNG